MTTAYAPRSEGWLLTFGIDALVLTDPDGREELRAGLATLHRVVDLPELYHERAIGLVTAHGSVTFRKNRQAHAELRRCVDAALAGDPAFCRGLRREGLIAVPAGLAMFVVCGGLFGLYCWFASWAPDPPPGHWTRWLGPLVSAVLMVLLGLGLAGPLVAYRGLRQWLRMRRIGRAARSPGPTE